LIDWAWPILTTTQKKHSQTKTSLSSSFLLLLLLPDRGLSKLLLQVPDLVKGAVEEGGGCLEQTLFGGPASHSAPFVLLNHMGKERQQSAKSMVVVCRHQSVVKMEDGRRRIKEEV
jgi:hypothetical protein